MTSQMPAADSLPLAPLPLASKTRRSAPGKTSLYRSFRILLWEIFARAQSMSSTITLK
jgi:hypothetical protein